MAIRLSEKEQRKMFRRAVATIPNASLRTMVIAAPHKALFGPARGRVASVWRPSGPVPKADPPIAGPILDGMVILVRAGFSVILIADDRESRDRAVALLGAALADERPAVLS